MALTLWFAKAIRSRAGAHGFEREGFSFDSGPSLYSGLSYSPSANPLRQVLDAIGEKLPCITYDTWGCCLPEGDFDTSVGASQFGEVLAQLRGAAAVAEWQQLQRIMEPYAKAATALPSLALRFDLGAVFTLGEFAPGFPAKCWRGDRTCSVLSAKLWTKMSKIRLSEIG